MIDFLGKKLISLTMNAYENTVNKMICYEL